MSKIHEINLSEIRIHSHFLADTLSAILQTIIFVRAPNLVKPKDQICETLHPLTFAKCGLPGVEKIISDTIEIFKKSLYQIGPGRHYRGDIVVSFYDTKEIKEYFGMVTRNENVYFERWKICVVLLDVTSATSSIPQRRNSTGTVQQTQVNAYSTGTISDLSEAEMSGAYYAGYDQVAKTMTTIIEAVNANSDHIPLTLYDYEMQVVNPPVNYVNSSGYSSSNTGGGNYSSPSQTGAGARPPGLVTKLINSPGMFNGIG